MAIVRRHLGDKVPVSDLADEYLIQPSLIYLWVKQTLDQVERRIGQGRGATRAPTQRPRPKARQSAKGADCRPCTFGIVTHPLNLRGARPRSEWQDAGTNSLTRGLRNYSCR